MAATQELRATWCRPPRGPRLPKLPEPDTMCAVRVAGAAMRGFNSQISATNQPRTGHTRTNSSHINCHRYVLSEVETLACPRRSRQRYSHRDSSWVFWRQTGVAPLGPWGRSERHATRKRDAAVHRDIADSGSLAQNANTNREPRARGRLARYHLRRFSSAGIFRVAPPHLQRPATASCLFHITHTTPERRRRTHTISDTHHRHIRTRHRMWCMASLPRST